MNACVRHDTFTRSLYCFLSLAKHERKTLQMIESERLYIRPANDGDHAFLYHMHSDPVVMRFILGRTRTEAESRDYLAELMRLYETHKMGQFIVFEKKTRQPLGRCGYSFFMGQEEDGLTSFYWGPDALSDNPDREVVVELGYTFARESWGKGYASEAAKAMFPYGRDVLKKPTITSLINQNNAASLKVAERNGLTRGKACRILGELSWVYSAPSGA